MHSVICTRARAPSGDDDRDSFEIHLRLQCATAPDADPVTRDPDPEKNKRARVNNVIAELTTLDSDSHVNIRTRNYKRSLSTF